MKKLLLFSGITFFFIFSGSNYVQAGAARLYTKTFPAIKNVHPVQSYNENKDIEGYYVSELMDGETENCSLSVKIKKVQGQYVYAFNIGGKIVKGKVKITKADNPEEPGIIFKGIEWAENNGDISHSDKHVALKLPGSIEGVWSESGIIIQNYGNSMNNYMQIASCGQKYINLVKQ